MPNDMFFVSVADNSLTKSIQISISIDSAEFSADSVVVFIGDPPGQDGPYPAATHRLTPTQLTFQGNINGVYDETRVSRQGQTLKGQISASPALPVPVLVGSYGGRGRFEMPAGTTEATFVIPIADVGSSQDTPLSLEALIQRALAVRS